MKTVKVIIERSKDMYSAYSENVEGIYGAGDSPVEAKKSILKSISLVKKYNKNKQIFATFVQYAEQQFVN